jgi:hypothetical protein
MGATEDPGARVPAQAAPAQGKKLLDRAWDALLAAGFEQAAAGRYVGWMRQYILHHGKRHPQDMGLAEIRQYLGSSVFRPPGGPERRGDAERALKFLYEQVLVRRRAAHPRMLPAAREGRGLGAAPTGRAERQGTRTG